MPCRLGSSILILILASFDAAAQSPYDNGPSIHPTPETSAGCGSGTIVMDSIAGETGSISLCWDTIYALLGVYDSPAIAPADNGASGGQFPSSPSGSNEQTGIGSSSSNGTGVNGHGANCPPTGNPVATTTRNKFQHETDYFGPGALPLRIERYYNSLYSNDSEFAGLFGAGWSSNFEERIVAEHETAAGVSPNVRTVIIQNESGYRFRLKSEDYGPWLSTSGRPVSFQKDPNTDLFTWIDGGLIKVFYGSGDLQSITHPYGEYLLFEYDETGSRPELNKVIHSSGVELTIHYDSAGRIDAIDDPAGNTYDYGYNVNDTDGNLDYVIRPAPSGTQSVSYEYLTGTSNPNRLKQILHSDTGQFAQFGYADTIGRASYTRRGNFVHSTERYDLAVKTYAPDLVIETTNPHGKKTEYTYQTIAGLKRLTRVDGISHGSCAASNSVYTYDAIGHIDTVTDEEGIVTDYDYNDFGLVESITRDGRTVTYQWDPIYNLPTMTSTDLLDVEIQLGELDSSESGRIKKIIQTSKAASPYVQNQTRIWDYTYDLYSDGTIERITIDGPLAGNNDRIVYEYDTKGLLQEQVQYTTATEKLTTLFQNYDPHGRVGKIVYPSGMERTFTYHPRGFVGTVTDKVNGIDRQTSFEYYASGDLKKVTYANGSSQEFDYDPARRVKEVSDNENNKVKYARDAASNVTSLQFSREDMGLVYVPPASCEPWDLEYPFCQGSWQWQVSDVLEYSVDYEYDSLSRLKAVERTLSERQDYTYFKNNQPKSVIDAYGRSTTYGYNDKNELSTTTRRDSGVVQFFYDDNGQTERIRDPLGVNTTYDRDGFGQTWRRVSPGTGTTAYEYDLAGNVIKKTDANGDVAHYEYDAASRLRYVRVNSNPNPIQSFTYNALTGFLDQVVDEVGTHTFVHNQAGEVLSLTSVVHGVSLNTSYTYNAMGQVETMTYPTGLIATYDYGTIGEVTKITVDNGGTLNNADVVKDVEYYPYGPVSNFDYGNNESRSNVLDLQYEPYKLLSGAHIDRTFTLDYNGNITGFDAESFTYDSMDRLGTYNDRDGVTFEYDYDLNGNRKWHKRNGAQTTYNYNSARTQLNSLAGATSESRSYDNNGNTIQIDNRYFDHDELNRLYRYRDGGLTVDYKYNAFGERQVKADGGPKVRFVYNGPWLLHERVGAVRRDYIYLGAEIVGMVKDGALYYVHNDHLGRPEVVTNGAGNPVWSSRNDAHDNAPIVDTIGGFNIGFPGQYYDVESGAYFNYFRTYDATTGRYLQSDPIGLAGGLNTYSYASSNPVSFIDPFGLLSADIRQRQRAEDFLEGSLCEEEYMEHIYADGMAAGVGVGVVILGVGGTAKEIVQEVLSQAGLPVDWIPSIRSLGKAIAKRVPSGAANDAARSSANAARLRGQLAGDEIAGGHAFEKHVIQRGEFTGLGIRTREQFARHIENVVNNPSASRQLSGGRTAFWDDATGTVVIRNPRAADGGTAFRPTLGREYFEDVLQ